MNKKYYALSHATQKAGHHRGDLEWAEGTFPTAQGLLYVKHVKQPDGKIKTEIKVPKGVLVVK